MSTLNIIKLIIIIIINLGFVISMITKKVSTLLALPLMGILTAVVATTATAPLIGWFDEVTNQINPLTKQPLVKFGIMNGVIGQGTIMMASAISAAIFGSAFSKVLNKIGVGEEIIKRAAELAGDRPLVLAISFYIASVVIFTAINGLGGIILIGSVSLPIMLSTGIAPSVAGSIVLLGISAGGLLNPANFATFSAILAPTMSSQSAAYDVIAQMSIPLFIIVFIVSLVFIVVSIKFKKSIKHSSIKTTNFKKTKKLSIFVILAPIIPVIIIIISTLLKKTFTAEIAIVIGMVYLLLVSRVKNKTSLLVSSFVEGTKEVSGAIVLLIGLGILIKGFQYPSVGVIIEPMIKSAISLLKNPFSYVIGFTLATPLVLYRGPLNTFGIGGALPVIFATAGFSPLAIIWVLRATGNLQGFGDPTNSQNIWIADFVGVDPNQITKKLFFIGIIISLLVLTYAVVIAHIGLVK